MAPENGRPLVSIGVPVYNGRSSIGEALDSLLRQTYDRLEIVIGDNASTDGTGDICREYAARDPRIKYYRNETNIGGVPNFNRVLELSTGEYFTWASADDLRPPAAIADCLEGFRRRPDAILVHGSVLWDIAGRDDLVEIHNRIDLSSPLAAKRIIAYTMGLRSNEMSYALYRRAALMESNTRFGTHSGTETVMLLRLCLVGPMERIDSPMIIYRTDRFSEGPMGSVQPLTVRNLLFFRGRKRMKCWIALRLGCYYLATCPGKSYGQRAAAVAAYVGSFAVRFRSHLTREAMLYLSTPGAWLLSPLIPTARRVRTALSR